LSRAGNELNRAENQNNSGDGGGSSSRSPLIPGINLPLQNTNSKILLLYGPSGVGKTLYCRQFLREGLLKGHRCVFVSTSLSKMQFDALFSNMDGTKPVDSIKFINPRDDDDDDAPQSHHNYKAISGKKLVTAILSDIIRSLETTVENETKAAPSTHGSIDGNVISKKAVRLVIDSLTHMLLLLRERTLMQFVMDLTDILRKFNATAILSLTTSSMDQSLVTNLGSVLDGVIEMRLKEDSYGLAIRSIRVRHIKGAYYDPRWLTFRISTNGNIIFSNGPSSLGGGQAGLTCTLCAKPIMGAPLVRSDFVFDSKECMEIYQRLENAYGSKISDTGLPSEAFDASFFFIDMVGLSDPTLSVKNQVHKIESLNELIHSCDAYRKVSAGKKVILPAGDGMAIGFLSKPEIPLELSIQLHRKLRAYNEEKSPAEEIGVRIGLASGPVFTVADLNNVQNIWGPGIILARRVMDAGDKGHILIAESLAQVLLSLKDEYRQNIRLISDKYKIKHGQQITLYTAYSDDFGNPKIPAKVSIIEDDDDNNNNV
jgi:KaiC/GvpD/RAD55 family RecA-like ATPase/class 3 adenylate cyclase